MQRSAECRHGLKAHNKIDSTTDVIYLGESTTAHSRLERRGLNDLRTCTIQWLSMTFCNLCLSLQPHSHWTKGKLIRPIAWNPGNPASVLITLSIIYRLSKMTFILKHWHKKNAAESRLRASPQRLNETFAGERLLPYQLVADAVFRVLPLWDDSRLHFIAQVNFFVGRVVLWQNIHR